MRPLLIAVVFALTLACKKETPPAEQAAPEKEAPTAAAKTPEKSPAAAAEPKKTDEEKPAFKLDDARLTKFMEFQNELQKIHQQALERIKEKSKSGDLGALAALNEPEKAKAEVKALQEKYGFSDEEQQWINDAIVDVTVGTAAGMPGLDEMKKQLAAEIAKGGPAGGEAAKALEEFEATAEKNLDDAKAKYGADTVAVIQKRADEITKFRTKLLKGEMP